MSRPIEVAAMRRAIELAARALGCVSPNPPVGCVVLDVAGDVAGEGFTAPPGGPHAEVVALRAARQRARGGTAVTTLEPCDHYGRTPPCSRALIEAGVARVVYALDDPVAGHGGGAATCAPPESTWRPACSSRRRRAATRPGSRRCVLAGPSSPGSSPPRWTAEWPQVTAPAAGSPAPSPELMGTASGPSAMR